MLDLSGFDTGANRAVDGGWFVFFGITSLFILGINKRTLAVLAGEDFIRHGYILHLY